MWRYLRAAFLAGPALPGLGTVPLNLVVVAVFGVCGFIQPGFWFLGLGLEAVVLLSLAGNPRFQKVIDAQSLAKNEDDVEAKRQALVAELPAESRARLSSVDARCQRLLQLNQGLLGDAISQGVGGDALARVRWLYLKLLVARKTLLEQSGSEVAAAVASQVAAIQAELAGTMPQTLRDSKTATLTILQQRLEGLQRRGQTLAEVESDLTRTEAQLDLAIDQAAVRGKPLTMVGDFDLVGRLLDSDVFGEAQSTVADLDHAYPAVILPPPQPGPPPSQPAAH